MMKLMFFDGFEEFISKKFPSEFSNPLTDLWCNYGKAYFGNSFTERGITESVTTKADGKVFCRTNSGNFDLVFLRWLECHACIGEWSTFKEAYERFGKEFEKNYFFSVYDTDTILNTIKNDNSARHAHVKFVEACYNEGHMPVVFIKDDIRSYVSSSADIRNRYSSVITEFINTVTKLSEMGNVRFRIADNESQFYDLNNIVYDNENNCVYIDIAPEHKRANLLYSASIMSGDK